MSKNQDVFFTLGQSDHTIIEWRLEQLFHKKDIYKNRVQPPVDDMLAREVEYSVQRKAVNGSLKSSFVALQGAY